MSMMTRRTIGLLSLVAAAVALSGANCLGPLSPIDHAINNSTLADQVIARVNAERAEAGLPPLVRNDILTKMADDYAARMAEKSFCSHEDPYTGETAFDRADKAGYAYRLFGENVAAGQRTADEVMDGWMNSPGHRENVLRPEFTEIGVGVREGGALGIYWCQEFGQPLQ